MTAADFGANEFTFTGDRTQITFFPVAPGPIQPGQEGARLQYAGPEGDFTFTGSQVALLPSPLGTVISVTLQAQADRGAITANLLLPHITGAASDKPVTFDAPLVKTTSRGFIATPGPDLTYSIVPLLGVAQDVVLPL